MTPPHLETFQSRLAPLVQIGVLGPACTDNNRRLAGDLAAHSVPLLDPLPIHARRLGREPQDHPVGRLQPNPPVHSLLPRVSAIGARAEPWNSFSIIAPAQHQTPRAAASAAEPESHRGLAARVVGEHGPTVLHCAALGRAGSDHPPLADLAARILLPAPAGTFHGHLGL